MEGLAKLAPVFKKDGVVTAGNASGIVDGAAALVLAGEAAVQARKGAERPLGRIVSWATVGVEPTLMGMGPAPAIRKALERARLSLGDLDLVEINEAFAPQYLACEKELGLDREQGQRQRRRHRGGPSAGRQRRAPGADAAAGASAPRQEVWCGVGVHRRRAGHCDDCGGGVASGFSRTCSSASRT